ncbi:MAG: hypothetical protein M1358_18710 [Chloroflexi bacterium]|nr:hypothetical protein [Chloroflexota bacterium]
MSLDDIVKRMSDQVLQIWIESCGVNPDLSNAVYLALLKEQQRRKRLVSPTETASARELVHH